MGHRPDDALACVPPAAEPIATGTPLPHDTIHVLVLSGGGARGAYGAGFLAGWSTREAPPARPQFDLVTGVSTGALMAPFALLGTRGDAAITRHFDGVASGDVLSGRSWLGVLSWNSLNSAAPMVRALEAELDDPTIEALSAAAHENRTVWVGATNSDTGAFTTFNLSRFALVEPPDAARHAISERIAASAAISGLLPPRFIGGCMYVDGGTRENLFVGQLAGAIDRLKAGAGASNVEISVIINGPILPVPALTDNTLVDITIRGFTLGVQQIQLASLREAQAFARARGYAFRWTSADGLVSYDPQSGACRLPQREDRFDAAFTHCLFDAGRDKAVRDPNPWRVDLPEDPASGTP